MRKSRFTEDRSAARVSSGMGARRNRANLVELVAEGRSEPDLSRTSRAPWFEPILSSKVSIMWGARHH